MNVDFDIRTGSLTGSIVFSQSVALTSSGTLWGRTPSPGIVLINGVNNFLNGSNNQQDFFVTVPTWQRPGSDTLSDTDAPYAAPEPASLTMLCIGGIAVMGWSFRRHESRPTM